MINQTFTTNRYVQSIMQIAAPTLAVVISAFALFGIFNIARASINEVRSSHEAGLSRTYAALDSELEGYVEDALAIARDPELGLLLDDPATDPRPAMRPAVDLISTHPDEYLAARLIARSGRVRGEVVNDNGTARNRSDLALSNMSAFAESDSFTRLINGDTGQTLLGDLRLQRNERGQIIDPPTVILDVFVPVYAQNIPRGVLHVEVNANDFFAIVEAAGGTLIDAQTNRRAILVNSNELIIADSGAISDTYQRNLEAASGNLQDDPLYQSLADFAQVNPSNVSTETDFPAIFSSVELAFTGVEDTGWQLFIVDQWFQVYSGALLAIAGIMVLAVSTGVGATYWLRNQIAQRLAPVEQSDTILDGLAATERQRRSLPPPASGSDLLDSAKLVRDRIQRLSKDVQVQMQRRNRDLQVAGRIGREAATRRDLESLATRSINLICNELGFYHAQIFLLDDAGVNAVLRYSRGEAGQKLIQQGHQLAVGSDTVIGTVTGERRVVIVNETTDQSGRDTHRFNPLLPDTRSEMGLPLIVQDELIGALDVQSLRAGAFDEDDIPTYQLIGDQLAIAIYNARLREQTQERIQQVDRLNRQLTRDAWTETEARLELDERYGAADVEGRIKAPISIRGEVIGSLDADLPDGQDFSEGDQAILQAVAERVALAIENARLFQETQTSLAETSTLYQLSRQLNEANTLEDVLQAIIVTVTPEAAGGQVWLFEDTLPGNEADWVRITVDLQIAPRPNENGDWVGKQLHLERHPFFDDLSADTVKMLTDIPQYMAGDDTLSRFFHEMNARSGVFIPLNMRGVWKGFLSIVFDDERRFSEREQRLYDALIGQAGVAIDNRLLLQQTEDALARQEKLYAASRIINTTQNLPDLVYAAVATTGDPSLDFWLGMLEGDAPANDVWPTRSRVIAQSHMGTVEETDYLHEVFVPKNSPMRNREPEVLVDPGSDLDDVPRPVAWIREQGYQFMAIFPLFSDNRPIALFYIVSEAPYELSNEDYEVYKALTGQMSTQIQNARLLQRTEETLREIRRLYVATRAISSAQELNDIYDAVAGHMALPFTQRNDGSGEISISVLLARPEPVLDAPELEYVYQWTSRRDSSPRVKVGALISQNDVPLGEYVHANDDSLLMYGNLADNPPDNPAYQELLVQNGAQSAAVVPLWSRQRWFGVMIVRTTMTDLLDESYTRFMQAIADQIAIAIENQSLLEETEFERERLNTILSTLPTGVLVLDPDTHKPRQHNDQVEELLGQAIDYDTPFTAAAYYMHRSGTDMFYPEDEMPINAAQRTNRQVQSDDVTIIRETGDRTDLLVSAAPIYDNQGNQQAIVAAFQDISTLRSMENTMQENLRETVLLYETQRTLAESDTLDDLLDNILMQVAMQQPADAFIFLHEDDEIRLARTLMQPIDNVNALRPLFHRDTQIVNDVLRSADLKDETRHVLDSVGARSALVLPMRAKARQQPLGWIMIVDTEPEAFTTDQERTLSSVADMASTALDNNYLVENIQDALQETADLYNAATSISRARDMYVLFEAIENALNNLAPTMYGIYLWEDDRILHNVSHNMEESLANGLDLDQLLHHAIPEDGLLVNDLNRSTLGEFELTVAQADTMRAFAVIDLRVKDVSGGRIFVGFTEPHNFDEGDQRYLNAISGSASVVIDNQLLLEQIQSTLQEQSVLYQASKALLETSQPHDILDVMVNFVIEPHVNQVFIAMLNTASWDAPGATVEVVASWQAATDVDLEGISLSKDQFPAWDLLATDRVLTIDDVENSDLNELEKISVQSLDTRSMAIIPLQVPNRSLGAIWIASHETYHYSDQNLRIFQAFGEQTSLTLEAERLLQQSEARAAQLQTSSAISQSVTQILDLDVLLPQVVDLIKDSFSYDHVQIFLMDEDNKNAVLRASTGEAGQKLLQINHSLPRGSESVIGRVSESGEASIALDTAEATVVHKPNPYLPRTRSEMALPLLIKGEVVGALDVQSNEANAFVEDDIRALETLASQIAVAIDNARLYEDVESSASDMSFLFEITTAAAAADTLEDSLTIIANKVDETLGAQAVVLYLPQNYEDPYGNRKTVLEPAAVSDGSGLSLHQVATIETDDTTHLVAEASRSLQARIISNIADESNYTPLTEGAQSAVLVPIDSAGNLIGMAALEHARAGAYDQDSVTLLRTLAGSVSAIIQNTLLLEQLQTTNTQLREMDRLKSQFLASMSHELRTPLNSIIGFSRVMLKGIDGPLTDMQEQDLQTIYTSGNHLLNLINDILDQAKIEANELNLKFGYFKIPEMVESVKSIAIGMMKDKPLSLNVEVGNNLPEAYGDEFRTRQILLNLVSNAIKFTQQGGIVIRAYAVENPDGETMLQIEVEDSGIGIAEKDMPILFEQFRQVDSSLTRTVGGTGLGLPISKSLTELQGGEMYVESEVNEGSVFAFTIPMNEGAEEKLEERKREKQQKARSLPKVENIPADKHQSGLIHKEDVERARQMHAESQAAAGNGAGQDDEAKSSTDSTKKQKKRPNVTRNIPMMNDKRDVVLIEDSKDMVDQFRRTLQREGFEVTTAEHPAYAEAMIGQLRPSLVLLDVNFADGQGWDVLKNLKERDDTFDIPVIVTTMSDDSERAYRLGAHTFIERPFLPDDLLEAVLKAEQESKRERILIIDDQPEAIRLLSQLLDEHGDFRIFSAESGDEGISLVARRHPDLIILDLRMPGKDGFAVLDELRDNPETAKIPVLVVTGDVDLNATELAQLQDIDILQKASISEADYKKFIDNVRAYLEANQ